LGGDYKEGIASAREALALAEKNGDTYFRYLAYIFIAWGTFGLGRAGESLPYWELAAEAAKDFGGRILLAEWFAAIEAEALIEAVDPATALRRAHQALLLSQSAESMIGEALAERAIGRALAAGGEGLQEALLHLARSAEICETIGARFEHVRSLVALGAAHLASDNKSDATTVLTRAQSMARECQLGREESSAQHLLEKLSSP
jgi:tetratricopeptide (TPR) repeat protein